VPVVIRETSPGFTQKGRRGLEQKVAKGNEGIICEFVQASGESRKASPGFSQKGRRGLEQKVAKENEGRICELVRATW
jgi:hypothetical protein